MTPLILDDDSPLHIVTTTDGMVFFGEIKINVNTFDLSKLANEFRYYQAAFCSLPIFKDQLEMLGELHFDPLIMSRRVKLFLQEYMDKIDPDRQFKHTAKIELSIQMSHDLGFSTVIGISPTSSDKNKPLLPTGTLFDEYLTPRLIPGFQGVTNDHKISRSHSFIFPLSFIPQVEFRDIEQPLNKSDVIKAPLCEDDYLIGYYIDYADRVILPCVMNQYKFWCETQMLKTRLTDQEVKDIWPLYRSKIGTYCKVIHTKAKENYDRYPDYLCRSRLGVIVHPNDVRKIDDNPFLIFEFVHLESIDPSKGFTAMTLETTGEVFDVKQMNENMISRRLQ